jgi:hypothetical protein
MEFCAWNVASKSQFIEFVPCLPKIPVMIRTEIGFVNYLPYEAKPANANLSAV